jgi:hypothetical protein
MRQQPKYVPLHRSFGWISGPFKELAQRKQNLREGGYKILLYLDLIEVKIIRKMSK